MRFNTYIKRSRAYSRMWTAWLIEESKDTPDDLTRSYLEADSSTAAFTKWGARWWLGQEARRLARQKAEENEPAERSSIEVT